MNGSDELWNWFECSRATFLTIPRVLLHSMPDEWQGRLAKLLREYDEAFPNQPELGTTVRVVDMQGNLVKTPPWLLNYRHPNREEVKKLRGSQ